MKRYLSRIGRESAIEIILNTFPRPDRNEKIPVTDAIGRVSSIPVYSPETIPQCRIASMDGVAVHSADTISAQDRAPYELHTTALINTGQQIPDGYDAVIPSEEICRSESGRELIRRPARPFQNIRERGGEVRKGQFILPGGHIFNPADIGALLTYGISEVMVRSLIVGLIPTGDELIPPGDMPGPGQVRESNTTMLAAILRQAGVTPVIYDIIPDDPARLSQMITTAAHECDIVVISAGSSAGNRDYTREVIEELGSILFHGVAIKPGKTLLCGVFNEKPVFGLPGQPVAALTACREVITPVLQRWGFQSPALPEITGRVAEPIPSDGGIDEYVFVSVIRIQGENLILPRPRGPGGQMHGIRANGILHIPARKEGYPEGAMVTVLLTRGAHNDIPGILLCGQSGILTDTLEAESNSEDIPLIIRPMSEIGAAAALCKGNCHGIILSGHPENRESEVFSFLRSACNDPLTVIKISSLQYGFCSPRKLTPADIPSLQDIWYSVGLAPEIFLEEFADQYSQADTINPGCLTAVETEDSVINAVKTGDADAGFCNEPAANEAGLFFLPIREETRFLVFREKPGIGEEISPLLEFLASDQWKRQEHFPPGYTAIVDGDVVFRITPETAGEGSEAVMQENPDGIKQ